MKILSFGEIIRDVYPDSAVIGGAPLNFCAHCVMCGAEGYILSAVGNDEAGEEVCSEVRSLGVKTDFVQKNDASTGACIVTLDENSIPSFNVLSDVAYDFVVCDENLVNRINEKKFDAFYFGTLAQRNEVSRKAVAEILSFCSFDNIFCDLNLRDNCYDEGSVTNCLEHATILKLSEEEEPRLHEFDFWKEIKGESVYETISNLFKKYPSLRFVIFTKGKDGSEIFERDMPTVAISATGSKVVSTVGAGDSFGAAWLSTYLSGRSPDDAARLASKVSGFVVSVKDAIPKYDINNIDEFIK